MSHPEKYLVTSATGNTGSQVALQLLANGRNVRVMSRSDKPIIQELKQRGVEVTLGSTDNRQDMQCALSGVQRVYYCRPIIPGLLATTKMFAEVAQQEKIESVVNLSQYLAELDNHSSKQTNEHKQSYQGLDSYLDYYDHQRRHQSLARKTPWEVYRPNRANRLQLSI